MDTPAVGRVLLDEALHLRCNFLLGGVGDACIGCVTWIQSFQVHPKLAILLICNGILFSLLPFALHHLILEILADPHLVYQILVTQTYTMVNTKMCVQGGYAIFSSVSAVGVLFNAVHRAYVFGRTLPACPFAAPWSFLL